MEKADFPKYLMIVNGVEKFRDLRQAAEAYDCGFGDVKVGGYVLNENFELRKLTTADVQAISNAADKYRSKK